MGLSYEEVPNFVEDDEANWLSASAEFVASKGFRFVMVAAVRPTRLVSLAATPITIAGLHIRVGDGGRGDDHAVLFEGETMVHDPHGSRTGLVSWTAAYVVTPKRAGRKRKA